MGALSVEALFDAYLAGLRGEVDVALEAADALGEADATSRLWVRILEGLAAHAEPGRGRLPAMDELAALAGMADTNPSALALAVAQGARGALLAFDGTALRGWCAILDRPGGEPRLARGWRRVLQGWAVLAEGGEPELLEHADASATSDPSLVVEATVLRAMAALETRDLPAALAQARRASRMGRTESLPQAEYLANVVLARVRRATGRPHLAQRILSALHRVAPAPWAPWLAWEAGLGGAVLGPSGAPFERLFAAVASGDRTAFATALTELDRRAAGFAPARADRRALAAVLDAEAPAAVEELEGWRRGQRDAAPGAARALGGSLDDLGPAADSPGMTWVVAGPRRPARRIVARGLPLHEAPPLRHAKSAPGRTEATAAALALAEEEGLPLEELFQRVYGFAYDPELHRGTFDVLLHRVRELVGEVGRLHRDERHVRLALRTAVAIPDPRSAQALEDLMLRYLARAGRSAAKEAAKALGVPQRTVSRALQQLVDEGACEREREGRRVYYRVEDTTFQEPTRPGTR